MIIFAIEASAQVAGCALLQDDRLAAEFNFLSGMSALRKTHSQSLMPMMEQVKDLTGIDLKTIDAVAVSGGPGSFTGLRIGAATAKGLGFALEKPLIPVSTLEALAFNLSGCYGMLPEPGEILCPVMDARRQQVYNGLYEWKKRTETDPADEAGRPSCLAGDRAMSVPELMDELNGLGRPVLFTGDAVSVYRDRIREALKVPFRFAPPHLSMQRAGSVAALARAVWLEEKEGCLVSADDFRPVYLRKPQAEREREAMGL